VCLPILTKKKEGKRGINDADSARGWGKKGELERKKVRRKKNPRDNLLWEKRKNIDFQNPGVLQGKRKKEEGPEDNRKKKGAWWTSMPGPSGPSAMGRRKKRGKGGFYFSRFSGKENTKKKKRRNAAVCGLAERTWKRSQRKKRRGEGGGLFPTGLANVRGEGGKRKEICANHWGIVTGVNSH